MFTGVSTSTSGMTSSKGPSNFFRRRPLRPSTVNNSTRRISNNPDARIKNLLANRASRVKQMGTPPAVTAFTSQNAANLALGPYNRRNSLGSELNALPVNSPQNNLYNFNNISSSDKALLNRFKKATEATEARVAAMSGQTPGGLVQPSVVRQTGLVVQPSVVRQTGLVAQPSVVRQPGLVRQASVVGQPGLVATTPAVVPPGSFVLPMEANVEEVHLDPKVIFPDSVTHIIDLKDQISKVTKDIEAIRPGLKNAITAAQALGVLNIGDKSFRGKNNPLVYVAHNTNVNDFVVRGDFTVDGRPFRVINEDSFNSVLSQMKEKRETAKTAIKGLGEVQGKVKGLETDLARLRQDLDKSTKKLRSNMRNYTAKHAKQMMRGLKPTTKVVSSANVRAAEALLQPKKSLWQRMTGRGGKNATRRNTRR